MRRGLRQSAAAVPLVVFLVLSAVPLAASAQDFLILTVYYFLLAASWNLLAGFTGQYSFAQAGLAACGAYVAGIVAIRMAWPIWTGFIVSPLVGLLVGVGLGLVALRVRGVQLSLITFAVASAFGVFLSADAELTGGSMGMQVPRLVEGSGHAIFLIVSGFAVSLYLFCQDRLLDSGFGLKMQAVRDEEAVAFGLGVNVYRIKVAAFALSTAVAGFAGAFYASYVGVLAPSMVSVTEMGTVVAMAVVGGLGYRYGALLGAFVLQAIAFLVRDFGAQYSLLITSGLTLLVILFFRAGLLSASGTMLGRFRKPRSPWTGDPQVRSEPPA
ncbi:MAG: branched-chain amino acid ABC transporter permease [Pseudomonadota bacterium]|nr:branched-chain amino acid ABC transporter permease [Pseudomonadota bacterium]